MNIVVAQGPWWRALSPSQRLIHVLAGRYDRVLVAQAADMAAMAANALAGKPGEVTLASLASALLTLTGEVSAPRRLVAELERIVRRGQ